MPHIHTENNQHELTVTAYIVRIDTPEPKVLLHMHRKLNMLLPVGGHVELSETPWQAIAHEIVEESGYLIEQLDILQPKSRIKKMTRVVQHPYPLSMNTHDLPSKHFHTDIQYAFVTSSDPAMDTKQGESLDLRWLTRNELKELPSASIFENTQEVYQFVLEQALKTWERVPARSFVLEFPEEYLSWA